MVGFFVTGELVTGDFVTGELVTGDLVTRIFRNTGFFVTPPISAAV